MSDISMIRGDAGSFLGVATKITNISEPFDLTDCDIIFTAKDDIGDTDNQAVITCDTSDGSITIVDAVNGKFLVYVAPAKTDSMEFVGTNKVLVYDVQVQDADGNVFTVDLGSLTITPDVTRRVL